MSAKLVRELEKLCARCEAIDPKTMKRAERFALAAALADTAKRLTVVSRSVSPGRTARATEAIVEGGATAVLRTVLAYKVDLKRYGARPGQKARLMRELDIKDIRTLNAHLDHMRRLQLDECSEAELIEAIERDV